MGNLCCYCIGSHQNNREPPDDAVPGLKYSNRGSRQNHKHSSQEQFDDIFYDQDGRPTFVQPQLGHINMIDPDNIPDDPTKIPDAEPKFSNFITQHPRKSVPRIQSIHEDMLNKHQRVLYAKMKANSCSTIYIPDSTTSQPNKKYMLKAVALAIFCHLKTALRKDISSYSNSILDKLFDEAIHPLSNEPLPADYAHRLPEFRSIYRLLRVLFEYAQMTAECAIITLVYLERLVVYGDILLTPAYWRRMLLGCVLLASKVWDDQAVWNVDFCQIVKHVTVEEMNELERGMLKLLSFNINVPQSVYAKYFFDLRTLAEEKGLILQPIALTKRRAADLEAVNAERITSFGTSQHLLPTASPLRRCFSVNVGSDVVVYDGLYAGKGSHASDEPQNINQPVPSPSSIEGIRLQQRSSRTIVLS